MTGDALRLMVALPVLAVVGACTGRVLAVCVARFPRHERLKDQLFSLLQPWRFCDHCQADGTLIQRLPVAGWLLTRGRCPECRRKRPIRVPLIEVLTAALFALLYWLEIPPQQGVHSTGILSSAEGPPGPELIDGLLSPVVWLHLRYALHMLMICGLIVATFIDLEFRIIPDGSTVPVMILAVISGFAVGQTFIVPLWFQDASVSRALGPLLPSVMQPLVLMWDAQPFARQHPHWHGLLVSLAGLGVGAGSVWIVRLIGFWVMKQEAMGFGDVVLMAMIGSVIGWQPVLTVFFLAPMLAVFAAGTLWLAKRDREIPYGPWLSLATLLLLVTWPHVWPFAKRIFDMGPILLVMGVGMTLSLAVLLQFVQIVKRLLGISAVDDPVADSWSSADHLSYYNSQHPDAGSDPWRHHSWPGIRSGRGRSHYDRWRQGGDP